MLLLLKTLLRNLILPPAGPLLLAMLGIFLMRRRPVAARVCLIVSVGSLWLLSTPVVSDAVTGLAESYPALDLSRTSGAQAIAILGGGGQITRAPEYGAPSAQPLLLEKLSYGAFLAHRTGLPILVTGADIEATAMRETLSRNFDTGVRWADDRSHDTFENARNSAQLLKADGIQRVVLVTRATHMRRSVNEFTAAGVDVVPAPVGILSQRGHGIVQYVPNPDALMHSSAALYELLGEPVRVFLAASHVRRQSSAGGALYPATFAKASASGEQSSGEQSPAAPSSTESSPAASSPNEPLPAEPSARNEPSAPADLVMTGQSANSISLSWTAATPGKTPIASYKIYRNGTAYATTTKTTYTDKNATNANSPVVGGGNPDPTLVIANTVYAYAVSAVDTAGNEGPQQANATFWVYRKGVFNWLGDFSYPGGGIKINYADTSGSPEPGPYDIEVSYTQVHAGFQPYAGKTTTVWDMEGGSFGYISMDVKPTTAADKWELFIISRLPPGDVYPWSNVNLADYGPAPVVGKWATYKIPLSVLTIGYTHFTGSISGTTLTVSSVTSGVGVDAGGYVTGPGVPVGTYIMAYGKAGGGAGTYTVAGPGINASTSVPSTSMVEQRTGIYKFGLPDQGNESKNRFYINNIKFSVN